MGSLYLVGGHTVPAYITWLSPGAKDEATVKVVGPPLPRERLAGLGPFEARLTETDGALHRGSAYLTHSEITPEWEHYTLLIMIRGWDA